MTLSVLMKMIHPQSHLSSAAASKNVVKAFGRHSGGTRLSKPRVVLPPFPTLQYTHTNTHTHTQKHTNTHAHTHTQFRLFTKAQAQTLTACTYPKQLQTDQAGNERKGSHSMRPSDSDKMRPYFSRLKPESQQSGDYMSFSARFKPLCRCCGPCIA